MTSNNLRLSEEALKIETDRPRGWEYLLLSILMDEEIGLVKMVLQQEIKIKPNHSIDAVLIRNLNDLSDLIKNIQKKVLESKRLTSIFGELSSRNAAVFGPPGKPGNSTAILMLAKRFATKYYEIATFSKKIDSEYLNFVAFSNRNIGGEIEELRVLLNVTEELYLWLSLTIKRLMDFFNDLGSRITSNINEQIATGHPVANKSLVFDWSFPAALSESIDNVTTLLESHGHRRSLNKSLSRLYSKSKKVAASRDQITTSSIQEFKSLFEFINWLAGYKKLSIAKLRENLLPLDLFPGAVIDEINERALDITGEPALEENGDEILINQDTFQQVVVAWNKN